MFRSVLPVKSLPLLPHALALARPQLLMPVLRPHRPAPIPLGWMSVKAVDYGAYADFTREAYSSGV